METANHLHFKGTCREAFKFYAETFGGRIVFSMTYGEAPGAEQSPPEARDRIIHARLELGRQYLLGCDVLGDRYQPPQGFNVMVSVDAPAEAERIFNILAAEGSVSMSCQETFWAYRFGMCTDRFGIPWMVNCARPLDDVRAPRAA